MNNDIHKKTVIKNKGSAAKRREIRRRKRRKRIIKNAIIIAIALLIASFIFYIIVSGSSKPDEPSVGVIGTTNSITESIIDETPTPTPVPTPSPEPTPTPEPTPEPEPVDLEYPYFIELDKSKQIVTVYTLGKDGYYDLICKQFICSTGENDKIEDGMYRIEEQYRWKRMGNGSYAQYASRISGPYLFHSCVYYTEKNNQLKQYYYNNLGRNVSSGCVRLTCGDAYWIYTHCKVGTPIRVIDSGETDDELKNSLWHPALVNINYDPTDPEAPAKYQVTPYPDATPDPTPALGVTPAPTPAWTVHPELHAWGYH